MARIALGLALLVFAAALPAEAVVSATGVAPAAAKKKKCKKGYVLKTVKKNGKKVKRCVKKKSPAPKPPAGGAPAGPGTGGDAGTGTQPATDPPAPTPGANQAPPSVTTRDDAAGQQAMSAGDLMLERAEFGSVTGTYYRIWLLQSGYFKYVEVSWSQQSGEICDKSYTGTWTFKEGYTFTESGGGTIAKITIASNGPNGDDLVTFANQDSGGVYIGANGTRFQRNPNMLNNC